MILTSSGQKEGYCQVQGRRIRVLENPSIGVSPKDGESHLRKDTDQNETDNSNGPGKITRQSVLIDNFK